MYFGFYHIPRGELYEIGTRLVGYDIRATKPVQPYDFMAPDWVSDARSYGFHVTITDALEVGAGELQTIVAEATKLLACLPRNGRYTFTVEGVRFWDERRGVLALTPNRNIELLHDLFTCRLNPLGVGSAYTTAYEQGKMGYAPDSPEAVKIKLFHSPYIFDAFRPHFTCVYPFGGNAAQRQRLTSQLQELLPREGELTMDRLALVVRDTGKDYYRIYQEFTLP